MGLAVTRPWLREVYFTEVGTDSLARGQVFNYYLYTEQSVINAFTLTVLDIAITVS
jgi:hypothetical protein